jgi:hypothetical protein
MSGVPHWVLVVVIVAVVLPTVIARQVRERELTGRRVVILPAIFLVAAFAADPALGHRLASVPALAMLAVGLVLAVLTGAARAATMRVRRVGGAVLTRGNGRTVTLWLATIALRVAMVAVSYAFGVPEGTGEALLFGAATFAAQGAVLAWRGGLFSAGGPVAATERIG